MKELAISGLATGFLGSALLASVALFRRKQGSWIVYGDLRTAHKVKGDKGDTEAGSFDTRKADRLIGLAKWSYRSGFVLLAVGFLLQLIGVIVSKRA
jgi:hypothetical protein